MVTLFHHSIFGPCAGDQVDVGHCQREVGNTRCANPERMFQSGVEEPQQRIGYQQKFMVMDALRKACESLRYFHVLMAEGMNMMNDRPAAAAPTHYFSISVVISVVLWWCE